MFRGAFRGVFRDGTGAAGGRPLPGAAWPYGDNVQHDVIVVGLGAMGSGATCHLARRGARVLGLDRFTPGHALGSSHGLTRIIRLAYFEDPAYVPLLRRAFALWRELEAGLPEPLLHVTGGLDVGAVGSTVFDGSLRSCVAHGLEHAVLDARELARRFPGWRPDASWCAVWQPDAGFLEPERCIARHLEVAAAAGARLSFGEQVLAVEPLGGRVRVVTDRGTHEAGQVVLTAGAWMRDLLAPLAPALAAQLVPERQVVGWFGIDAPEAFAPRAFPVFVLESERGTYYGFPQHGVPGFKIGRYHHRAERVHPDTMDRDVHAEDEAALREATSRWFPQANGPLLSATTCLFTNTPDEHFVIDRVPGAPEVIVVSACSGHGFKFASVVGEVVAELVCDGATRQDIGLFGLRRRFGT